jgi:hypothetical protein
VVVKAHTALIADSNTTRAAGLQQILEEARFDCCITSTTMTFEQPARVLFVAGDIPDISGSDQLIRSFAETSPGAPIVVLTEAPLWRLITLAVRERAWMDLPGSAGDNGLLTRYATSRSPYPKIIIEASPTRCDHLLTVWPDSAQDSSHLSLVHSVGDALETAIDGRVPVLLNLNIPTSTLQSPDISTLIYSLCPAVIAVLAEASNSGHTHQSVIYTEPKSRFVVLKPPFHSSEFRTLLLSYLNVAWPMTSPL